MACVRPCATQCYASVVQAKARMQCGPRCTLPTAQARHRLPRVGPLRYISRSPPGLFTPKNSL